MLYNLTSKDLRIWRRNQKISRKKLSEMLGVHLSTVYRWEHDKTKKIPPYLGIILTAIEWGVLDEEESYL